MTIKTTKHKANKNGKYGWHCKPEIFDTRQI